jgi:hypothetical protein
MADAIIILTILGFISVAVMYVSWCDRIIGQADDEDAA